MQTLGLNTALTTIWNTPKAIIRWLEGEGIFSGAFAMRVDC